MGVAALLLAASALLSRLMGLGRDKLISWQFGATHEADMYFAAFVVPDIINYLLAGGFMSITLLPLLGRLFQENERQAWRFFSCALIWMGTGAIALTLAGEIWAIPFARATAPGFSPAQLERLAFFTRIILPGQIFFLLGAPFTALLFLRRQFTVPAFSPLIYNGCIILLGLSLPRLAAAPDDFGMTGYCIGVTCGAFLGAFLLPFATARMGGAHFSPCFYHPALKKFLWLALPLMLGQTVVMLDEQFLRIFGSMLAEGSVSILNYARRIAQVPISLVGQSAAVASYPFLVKLLAESRLDEFNQTINKALRASMALIIPCSMGMIAATGPILGAIFEGGRFGAAQTAACIGPTRIMLAAAPLWVGYMVLARGFYACADTLTPALTGTALTILCLPVYYLVAVPAGIHAIAYVSTLALAVYLLWLAIIWIRRHGGGAFAGLGALALKSLLCCLPPTAGAWLCIAWCAPLLTGLKSFFAYGISCGVGAITFLALFLPLAACLQPDLIRKFKTIFQKDA